ncbi:putative chromate transport protein [Desulfosporosinus acididurans]|uniref:Putative chromate transport protein n=1 Tax=Desulfosporosinus acididurans TaxID=476652 RepID=A0A0J1IIZ1_9FIRM|nr:chromate transporter [Desulfosporosinus acididurans]KLU64716.1 putative chromate transport protein [Desulfosporosinus acididurans]
MEKKRINFKFILEIFFSFFKISPLSFGGGFAMIPIMEEEVVHKKKWVKKEQIVDIFAIIQSLPGAIAVNAASLVGYQVAGIVGAIAAFLGVILPTFAIMVIFGAMLITYQHNFYVQAALQGIRPVVVAMIASAAFKMSKVSLIDKTCLAITALSIVTLLYHKSLIFVVIVSGAILGIVLVNIRIKLNRPVSLVKASERK